MPNDTSAESTEAVQITFDNEPVENPRERPDTFLWCDEEETWVLRSLQVDWPYELYENPDSVPTESDTSSNTTAQHEEDEDDDDEPREVGGVFSVSLSYDVTYRKQVPAANETQAIEIAKDELSFADDCPVDAIHLHDEASKQETLTEDDDRCEEMPGWPW